MILNPSLPAPSLPDAGRPFVDSCTFDAATRNVNVRARNAQAGEVKDPIGEEQEFPISSVLQGKGWLVNKVLYELNINNESSIVRRINNNVSNEPYYIQPGEKKRIEIYSDARSGSPVALYSFIGSMVHYIIHPTSGLLTFVISVRFTDAIEA